MNGMPETHVTAAEISKGHTIVERTERGTVEGRYSVLDTGTCPTDPGNVHVIARDAAAAPGSPSRTWCYCKLARVELM